MWKIFNELMESRGIKSFTLLFFFLICFMSINAIYLARNKQFHQAEQNQHGIKPSSVFEQVQPKENHMILTSVFEHMGEIPSVYTCDGQDLAPILHISGVPERTQELALIVDDPDAPVGNWVHWVLYNIPSSVAVIDNQHLAPEISQGMTDFGRIGWGGPCPPDREHRYFFKLYALDTQLNLPSGLSKRELENAMQGHIIEQTELIGRYDRLSRRT